MVLVEDRVGEQGSGGATCPGGHRKARRRRTAIPHPAIGCIGGVINGVIDAGSFASFNPLFSAKKMAKEILRSNGHLVPGVVLDQAVIFFVEPVEDEASTLQVTKGLANIGQVSASILTLTLL
jgi:hypothetical protein